MATVITDYNDRYNLTYRKPPLTMIRNNGGQPQGDIRFLGYVLQVHEKGRHVWNYRCRVKGCRASISLRLQNGKPDPNNPSCRQLLRLLNYSDFSLAAWPLSLVHLLCQM